MKPTLLILLILSLAVPAFALDTTPWNGHVSSVSDGDTVTVTDTYGQAHKIRLWGIDCPESRQEWGDQAKAFTKREVLGKEVQVGAMDQDQYGRMVAIVWPVGAEYPLNEALIRYGHAWVYSQFCSKPVCTRWEDLQDEARRAGLGLWSESRPVAPWVYRQDGSSSSSSSSSSPLDAVGSVLNILKHF